MHEAIDVCFDFRDDAGGGDPDRTSRTLRRYHRSLWSKHLPGGEHFELTAPPSGPYLHHRSALGEFVLTSDSIMPTFTRWTRMKPIIEQIPEVENEAFRTEAYTIGAMMVFPGNRVDGLPTINGARGFNSSIADRFDLTLECIRRFYLAEHSPLMSTLARYAEFFALFGDFAGYVRFFLLDDLVTDEGEVRFFMPFEGFGGSAVPKDVDTYTDYRRLSLEFIAARNGRIADHCTTRAALSPLSL